MNVAGKDMNDMVQCPYEKTHLILKTRFQVHLGRCRRNHPTVVKKPCPFNVTHLLNEPELEWHVTVCPDRASFDNFVYSQRSTAGPAPADQQQQKPKEPEFVLDCEESWDNEPDVPSYNPNKYTEQAPVLRLPRGCKPSDRKKFRASERERLLNLEREYKN